jgi:hypothetical protein
MRLPWPIGPLLSVSLAAAALWLTAAVANAQALPGVQTASHAPAPLTQAVKSATSGVVQTTSAERNNAASASRAGTTTVHQAAAAASAAPANVVQHAPAPPNVPTAVLPSLPSTPKAPKPSTPPPTPRVELPEPSTLQAVPEQVTRLAESAVAASNVVDDARAMTEPVVEPVAEATAPLAAIEESVDATVERVVDLVGETPAKLTENPAPTPVALAEGAGSATTPALQPAVEDRHDAAEQNHAADLGELDAMVALAASPSVPVQLEEPGPGLTATLIAIHDAAPLQLASHAALRDRADEQASRAAIPHQAEEQAAQAPTEISSQPTNPSQWSVVLAARSLTLDDDEQAVSTAVIAASPAFPRSTSFAANYVGVHGLRRSLRVQIEPSSDSLPAAPWPPAPVHSDVASAASTPAPAPGSAYSSGNGPAGVASPLFASLALLAAWRALWLAASLRPSGIVLPSLAPPG